MFGTRISSDPLFQPSRGASLAPARWPQSQQISIRDRAARLVADRRIVVTLVHASRTDLVVVTAQSDPRCAHLRVVDSLDSAMTLVLEEEVQTQLTSGRRYLRIDLLSVATVDDAAAALL